MTEKKNEMPPDGGGNEAEKTCGFLLGIVLRPNPLK